MLPVRKLKELNKPASKQFKHWGTLFMAVFDGKGHIIGSIVEDNKRFEMVELFKKNYEKIFDFSLLKLTLDS